MCRYIVLLKSQRLQQVPLLLSTLLLSSCIYANTLQTEDEEKITLKELSTKLEVGDLVFIRVSVKPFLKVADSTGSWTNHVGIVIDTSGNEPMIGESTFPLSKATKFSRFIARSESGRVAISRVDMPLTQTEQTKIKMAAESRLGIFYDTGFNINSRREFCSRYAREVLDDATGIKIGEIQSFSTLFANNPNADLKFWRLWYFGNIPWQRETVTPASLLTSQNLTKIFDGVALR